MTNLIWFFGIYVLVGVVVYLATNLHFGMRLYRVLNATFGEVKLDMMIAWGRVYAAYLTEYWMHLAWYWRVIKVICWPAACYDKVHHRGIIDFMDYVKKNVKEEENN